MSVLRIYAKKTLCPFLGGNMSNSYPDSMKKPLSLTGGGGRRKKACFAVLVNH